MSTVKRESQVKNMLDQRHPRKNTARKPNHPLRGHRRLVKLSEEEIARRELGWNDRFTVDPPPISNKVPSPAHSPSSVPPTPLKKESRIRNERTQYGKRGGKRNREPKKPSSGKLVPLDSLRNPPSEAAQPTKEEKLRFKVLKAIDARETLLYQLSALILCTSVQESLFLPSRPIEPPTSISGGRQQMRSRGGMALASTPLSRHGGNSGAMSNAREATKLAQQLAKDLQVTGIQCVEALVEWMLEAGAQAETPPPFMWRGQNYFLKMANDLDFAEAELQARGVNLDCFSQANPLLVKPNQKLGRVLAAQSIIAEFTKDISPKELLALSGRMRNASCGEREASAKVETHTNSRADLAGLNGYADFAIQNNMVEAEEENPDRKHGDSAADLVDLLDESLEFIRENVSREGDANLTEPNSDNDFEDDDEKNQSNERDEHMFQPPGEDSMVEGDDLAGKLEPEDGGSPRMNTVDSEKEEVLDMPTDNQSDNEDNLMDADEHMVDRENVEAVASELMGLPKSPPEEADTNGEPEQVSYSASTVGDSSRQERSGNTSEPTPESEQSSSRTNGSDNQSEYDNSFNAEAGNEDGERESDAGEKQTQSEDTLATPESAETEQSTAPNESSDADHALLVQNAPIDPPALTSHEIIDLPKSPPEEADTKREPEQVSYSASTVGDSSRQERSGNTSEPTPESEQSSSRTNGSDNQSEYDNSFDAEAGNEEGERESDAGVKQTQSEDALATPEGAETEQSAARNESSDAGHALLVQNSPIDPPALLENVSTNPAEDNDASDYENSFEEDVDEDKASNNSGADRLDPTLEPTIDSDPTTDVPPILGLGLSQSLIDAEIDQPVPEAVDAQTVSERLLDELKRWAFLEGENRPTEVNVPGCLSWCSSRLISEALQTHSSISEGMEGSIISMLEQYGLAVPESPLESFLSSEVARGLDLAVHLIKECQYVLDDVFSTVATDLQLLLESKNSLVSEIEIEEVLEDAENVRQLYHESTWECLRIASTLFIFLHSSDKDIITTLKHQSPVSAGLSRIVKIFYPYLVNHPREELRDNWHSVSSILAAMGPPVDLLYRILDPLCKTLLLAVEFCNDSTQYSKDEADLAVFPKVTIICDRVDVLQSSVQYAWQNHLSSEKVTSNFSLFPFFKSSFGEKLVEGVKVEEGEGKGPLKEWFGLIGTQMASKWKQISTRKQSLEGDFTEVIASGNVVKIPGTTDAIRPGFQLEWETSDGEKFSRVVNNSGEDDTFLLDRGVPSHTFPVSQLRISQPNPATFAYVQASESYWLNENTRDSPEAHNLLIFVGWFLASAITHFSAIQLRIHPLFFRLLLNPQYCVTIDDLRLLDPQLANSLSSLKDMKLSDFVEYLRFEGADESISVEAYIGKALGEKFGPSSGIGWQLDLIRRGFTRVITIDQLSRVGITEADLVESICGSGTGYGGDFDIASVFRVAADTEFTSCQPLMNGFWKVVNAFDPQLKRKFIKFVTGVDTLPLGGTEFFRIEMPFTSMSAAEHEKCLQMLPQAHTCDNTLELPHYWKSLCWREKHDEDRPNTALEEELVLLLRKKLQDAVEYSSGYGLDGTSAVTGVLDTKECLDGDDQLANEESYNSLGLPALSEDQSAADLPAESSQPPPPAQEQEEVERDDETADAPAASASVVSPRSDESYDECDWEDEE